MVWLMSHSPLLCAAMDHSESLILVDTLSLRERVCVHCRDAARYLQKEAVGEGYRLVAEEAAVYA